LGLLTVFSVSQARTITVDFDDVDATEPDCDPLISPVVGKACTRIHGPYRGYLWNQARIFNGCFYDLNDGYCRGTASPSNVMVSWRREVIQIRKPDGRAFNFYGASVALAQARFSPDMVQFVGFRSGTRVFDETLVLRAARQDFNVNFENVDSVQIGSTRSIVFDNVRLSESLCQTPGLHFNLTSPTLLHNHIYYAYADFDGCSGSLTATTIDTGNGSYGDPYWDAACTLTGPGPACSRIAPALQPQTEPGYYRRTLLTLDPNGGADWPLFNDAGGSTFTSASSPAWGPLSWLQYVAGSRRDEAPLHVPVATLALSADAVLRPRNSRLGDIVQSSPVAVGAPGGDWNHHRQDILTGADRSSEALAYSRFLSEQALRTPMVYVGANDGFLHGFRTGLQGGRYQDDGAELLAYAPAAALRALWSPGNPDLSLADHAYDHQFFVDATVGVGDAYVNHRWQTLLMGGLGAGGRAGGPASEEQDTANGLLYVLDITEPDFFGNNGVRASRVRAQEVHSGPGVGTIRCSRFVGARPAAQACASHFGAQYGTPQLGRMHNGHWAMIAGNGLYSASGAAGIFLFTQLDQLGGTGNYFLNSGAVPALGRKNGVVQVTLADLDGDGVVDYIYAGDVLGNVWRFDVTSARPQDWLSTPPVRVFSTPNQQPISTRLLVNTVGDHHAKRVVIQFGTGRAWPLLRASGNRYATGPQAIYGIWDWHFTDWNTRSAGHYQALVAAPANAEVTERLVTTVRAVDRAYRTVLARPICWIGESGIQGCTHYSAYGWKLELPAIGTSGFHEQVVFDPQLVHGLMVVNTLVPGWPLETSKGFTMTLGADGGAPLKSFFPDASGLHNVVGAELDGLGTAVFYTDASAQVRMYQKDTGQSPTVTNVLLPPVTRPGLWRLTWRSVR